MADWIYVLELSPPGYVKVGQTTNLAKRLTDHIRAVGMSGAVVTRVFSVVCTGVDALEQEILNRVAEIPGAVAVNGREVFAGVTFLEVATIADREVGLRYRKVRLNPGISDVDNDIELRDLLEDVRAALGPDDEVRAADMVARLRELAPGYPTYKHLDGRQLKEMLAGEGVEVKLRDGNRTVRVDRVYRALEIRQKPPRSDSDGAVLTLVEDTPA